MEEEFPETGLDEELQTSKICDGRVKDVNSLQDLKVDTVLQDQHNHNPESLKQDQGQQSLHSSLDHVQVQEKESTQDEVEAQEHKKCPPDPPQDQLEVLDIDQNPTEDDNDQGRALGDHLQSVHVSDQDLLRADPGQRVDLDRDHCLHQVSAQDQGRAEHQGHTGSNQDQNQDLTTAAANQEVAGESGGSVPALVITQAEESWRPALAVTPVEPRRPQRPSDLVIPVSPTDPSLSSSSDGGDMACSDLLSLKSDSLSLTSERTVSRTSEEDDSQSVAASSVMSLFHRVQLDPLERDWLRSSALGNMAAQRLLLSQEPSLVLKKTALHWAAKQGHQEAVDMMLRSGADVNIRSGYTALHLASIHGHQHVIHALINTYNAKTNIRDYHGKTAAHYWSGCTDIFNKPDAQSGGRFFRGRWTQRYALPSLLLSRSRSQGQLNLEFGTVPQSASYDGLDLQV